MDMKGFPTSSDIYLELDGKKVAVVQSYTAKAVKSSRSVEAFGESEPVATIEGQRKYTLELTLLGHRNNSFGPVHLADPKSLWIGPNAWRSTGNQWTESYRLKPLGITSAPTIEWITDNA